MARLRVFDIAMFQVSHLKSWQRNSPEHFEAQDRGPMQIAPAGRKRWRKFRPSVARHVRRAS
jgi:hypothetical protein